MRKEIVRRAFLRTIPVMAGYLVLGMGFGILMEKNGYGALWAVAMSVFVYAGSMQYLAVSLLTAGASLISVALAALMVNARHLFYGLSMVEKYQNTGRVKPYLIFALSDETYSLVCGEQTGETPRLYYFLVSLFDQCYWVAGTALGVLAGTLISFNTAGIDFAMTALFVTVFVEQWLSTKNHIPALTGVLASVLCLLAFGPDRFLIPAMLAITLILSAGKKQMEKRARDG